MIMQAVSQFEEVDFLGSVFAVQSLSVLLHLCLILTQESLYEREHLQKRESLGLRKSAQTLLLPAQAVPAKQGLYLSTSYSFPQTQGKGSVIEVKKTLTLNGEP